MSVLGTVIRFPFHGLQEFAGFLHHRFTRFSPLRYSTGFAAWTERRLRPAYPEASGQPKLLQPDGTGMLTCFPFDMLELRHTLGPTDPWLTNSAEETWPLRRLGFSPNYAPTSARIFIPARSTGPHGPTSAQAGRLSTRSPCGAPWSL